MSNRISKFNPLTEPEFNQNTFSDWFDWWYEYNQWLNEWLDDLETKPPTFPPPVCRPERVTINGKCFEKICTPTGPLLQHCYFGDILHDKPLIKAIRITDKGYQVDVQSKKGVQSFFVKYKDIKLRHLGLALIHEKPLPNINILKVRSSFWKTIIG